MDFDQSKVNIIVEHTDDSDTYIRNVLTDLLQRPTSAADASLKLTAALCMCQIALDHSVPGPDLLKAMANIRADIMRMFKASEPVRRPKA